MTLQDNPLLRIIPSLPPEDLRRSFLVAGLFQPGEINLRWWETDRTVMAAATPLDRALALPNPTGLRSRCFLERREAGVINLGGPGTVTVAGEPHALGTCDALYLGRGQDPVTFDSERPETPARFWIISYPAHAAHPVAAVPRSKVEGSRLGSRETANERTLYKLIHPGTVATCQLVMGFTQLEPGSVWNSVPPHTHLRRSEVYLYFGLPAGQSVFHFMGEPTATRHLVVHDLEAVLSPPWSIHCGSGTSAYGFVWCMGGENQEFTDMDPAPIAQLR